ncbi:ion transporter [Salinicola sp. JS01]|uniref:ion transporter n=1 Tax=Salinicola sp. JS01 TaxID=3050071 RepID=UPI00255BAB7F|nr:ion transporter [Salinicola sp. JS01]WIX31767.1 ion transporter [Salinicola sp. JS01]
MKQHVSPFQLFVLAMSFYVLAALFASAFLTLPPEIERLIGYLDYVVCAVFFIDFCLRFHRAPNKWRYMRWGWLDLLSCIPAGWFQAARLARVVQVLRILRALRSMELIWQLLFRNRAEGVLASVATATVLLVVVSAVTVLLVEAPDPHSPINTAEDALWWAIVTVTTVGYGDYYPVTTLGRVVAVLLMVCGVGLFGSFAAYVSSLFVEDQGESESRQHKANRRMMRHMIEQVSELQAEIEALRGELRTHRQELEARHVPSETPAGSSHDARPADDSPSEEDPAQGPQQR